MKIAFLSPAWPVAQAQNGIATYVDTMTSALRKAGHECVVITPKLIGVEAGRDVFQIKPVRLSVWEKAAKAFRRRLSRASIFDNHMYARAISETIHMASQNIPFDVVEVEESFGFSYHLQKLLTAPVVTRLHGPHFLGHIGEKKAADEWRIESEGRAIRNATAITSPSAGLLEETLNYYKHRSNTAVTIPNPVEIQPIDDCWSFENCDRNIILFVGRFDMRKGADVMLRAFSQLSVRFKDARLIMVGKDQGVPGLNGEMMRFAAYAKAHLSDEARARVEFKGPLPHDQLAALRRRAFVYVSSSRFECFPYAVTESLALGCPVVASSTFGPQEFLNIGEEIFCTELGDSEQLADNLAMLFQDPAIAKRLAAAGRRGAARHVAPEIVTQRSVEYYQQVISRWRTSHSGS